MINPKDFLNTAPELHALTHGICEVICPWPPFRKAMSEERAKQLQAEYHYYLLGRATGVIAWLGIAKLIKETFS